MTTNANASELSRPYPIHRDRNGRLLHVGDLVRYGDAAERLELVEGAA